MTPAGPEPFATSPNTLFATRVSRVRRLSPGFVRVTLAGSGLVRFAPHGLDQRVKILLGPTCPELVPGMPERDWRRVWRAVPEHRRPVLRSYTAYAVRSDEAEIDLDFYVHDPAGPASDWALGAAPGDPLLVSGPDVRAGRPDHGVQWEPGSEVREVLVAGDETAYPAVRGILTALPPAVRARVLLEAGDPADAATLDDVVGEHAVAVLRRGDRPGGLALVEAVTAWGHTHGAAAAVLGEGFYAWVATESTRVRAVRDALLAGGVDGSRVHTQGYWHHRGRVPRGV
ncbi:siderophore-interacting protein [Cellulomonas triticagri]|uniref:Siderophore-interacting protein n=1 Tax=Cellulomonas triticagri TaxID=2483352 RepID=A0A3M2JQP1_9CELL|nr:siderophore-interacting protein [Cellulomonas triticagri]RMI12528.1 siderophore-interacting protein [Cellulomonas triticagri]